MKRCINCGLKNNRPKSNWCSRKCEKRHRRKEYKAQGKCTRCGSVRENENILLCNGCTEINKQSHAYNKRSIQKQRKDKRESAKQNNLCTVCLKRPPEKNILTCKQCHDRANRLQKKYRNKEEYPRLLLLSNAKTRSKQFNLPFDLCIDDIVIPNICPILGIPLKAGNNNHLPSSPSLDRIIPELGYVRGNVCVISYKANQMKSDLTREILLKLLSYIERVDISA